MLGSGLSRAEAILPLPLLVFRPHIAPVEAENIGEIHNKPRAARPASHLHWDSWSHGGLLWIRYTSGFSARMLLAREPAGGRDGMGWDGPKSRDDENHSRQAHCTAGGAKTGDRSCEMRSLGRRCSFGGALAGSRWKRIDPVPGSSSARGRHSSSAGLKQFCDMPQVSPSCQATPTRPRDVRQEPPYGPSSLWDPLACYV